jgi:hypothetical protein
LFAATVEDAMTSGAGQAFMLSAGVFVASFVAIFLLKFIEQARGASAPSIEALTDARGLRK